MFKWPERTGLDVVAHVGRNKKQILGMNQSIGESLCPNNSEIDSCIKRAVCMQQV